MNILERFVEGPEECPYLHDRQATHEYEIHGELLPDEYEERMNQGWRKFGLMLFRPQCSSCRECRPIRVLVDRFIPNRSQRRVDRGSADIDMQIHAPLVDAARLDLLHRYHSRQELRRQWKRQETSEEGYYFSFVLNRLRAYELSFWKAQRLVAVILLEETVQTLSAIYHYHELGENRSGFGTLAILHAISLAQRLGKRYLYLGYHVRGCISSEYKARFKPFEICGVDGIWKNPDEIQDPVQALAGKDPDRIIR